MSNRVVLSTIGSLGDLHPFIGIAIELKKRGYQAVIATSEIYASRVRAEGIEFYPLGPNLSFDKEVIERAMDSYNGARYIHFELVLPHLKNTYHELTKVVQGADLLISHPLCLASPLVAEKTGIRWVSSILSPLLVVSAYDSIFLADLSGQILSELMNCFVNSIIINSSKVFFRTWTDPIRQLRAELRLNPGGDALFEGKYSSKLVLALFSEAFAKPQPDWFKQICVTGFTFYDGSSDTGLPLELSQFLNAGPPPIVFTLGSSAVHVAGNFYLESAIAAKKLGYRAVLLTGKDKSNIPRSLLSENIVAFDYVPYSMLFPHAAVIVHQGGLGTTAQALRSGRPMLIVPFSHDQPNNAARVERLSVARTIARDSYTAERAATELSQILNNPTYAKKAAELGRQIQAENGVQAACDLVEAQLRMPA